MYKKEQKRAKEEKRVAYVTLNAVFTVQTAEKNYHGPIWLNFEPRIKGYFDWHLPFIVGARRFKLKKSWSGAGIWRHESILPNGSVARLADKERVLKPGVVAQFF